MRNSNNTIIHALLLCATMLLRMTTAGAQSAEPFSPYSSISPSIEAWQMTKSGNLKPSLYTGAMVYSIPVYTYTDPDFNIPVTLQYSFDGYKPSQDSGTIGYGWYLDAGGVITREVRGLPDEDITESDNRILYGYYYSTIHTNGYDEKYSVVSEQFSNHHRWATFSTSMGAGAVTEETAVKINPFNSVPAQVSISPEDIPTFPNWYPYYEHGLGSASYDMTPDIYHFSFLGHTGDFMLMPDGTVRVFNSDLPHGELDVSFDLQYMSSHTALEEHVSGFTITDGNGYKYHFGNTFQTVEFSATKNTTSLTNSNPPYTSAAWHLKTIEAPNGRTVDFCYSERKSVYRRSIPYCSPKLTGATRSDSVSGGLQSFTLASLLENISVDGCPIVTLSYSAKLHDEFSPQYYDNYPYSIPMPTSLRAFDTPLCLSGIDAVNSCGEVVEKLVLAHEYVTNGTPKMLLSGLSSMQNGIHQFVYNTSGICFPNNDTCSTDHWDYWNGKYPRNLKDIAVFSISRYSQMRYDSKDPDFSYCMAGALTCITYPTGGQTTIEYEANVADSCLDEDGCCYYPNTGSMTVGGVRVSGMSDSDPCSGTSLTTRYSYHGGFLYHMPRHVMTFNATFQYYRVREGVDPYGFPCLVWNIDTFSGEITGYGSDCDYSTSRDCLIGYSLVEMTHPDNSCTSYCFSNYDEEYSDSYPELMSYYQFKKRGIFSHYDGYIIGSEGNYSPYRSIPNVDRKNMRGNLLRVEERDSSGFCRSIRTISYGTDTVSLGKIYFNNLESYACTSWQCDSPLVTEERVTDNLPDGTSFTTVRLTGYNAGGQVRERKAYSPQIPGDSTIVRYSYQHEHTSDDVLAGAMYSVRKSRLVSGTETVLDETRYYYSSPMRHTNPSWARRWRYLNGAVQGYDDTQFTYDPVSFRPTRVSLPGGAYYTYTWDGNNLSSATSNASGNITSYDWKDLVGLTGIHHPDGTSQAYRYDSKNRLWKTFDSSGNLVRRNDVHLENEISSSVDTH